MCADRKALFHIPTDLISSEKAVTLGLEGLVTMRPTAQTGFCISFKCEGPLNSCFLSSDAGKTTPSWWLMLFLIRRVCEVCCYSILKVVSPPDTSESSPHGSANSSLCLCVCVCVCVALLAWMLPVPVHTYRLGLSIVNSSPLWHT